MDGSSGTPENGRTHIRPFLAFRSLNRGRRGFADGRPDLLQRLRLTQRSPFLPGTRRSRADGCDTLWTLQGLHSAALRSEADKGGERPGTNRPGMPWYRPRLRVGWATARAFRCVAGSAPVRPCLYSSRTQTTGGPGHSSSDCHQCTMRRPSSASRMAGTSSCPPKVHRRTGWNPVVTLYRFLFGLPWSNSLPTYLVR